MIRLDPPIPVRIPHGDAHAYFVTDRGKGFHLEWTCAVDETGEFWTVPNPHVRRQTSISDGWHDVSDWTPDVMETYPWLFDQQK